MAAPFYNQTTLFYNQTVSSLFLFHVPNGASERNVILATKRGDFNERPQEGSQILLSRPFFPVNPAIPPVFAWKFRSRPLFKDVSALIINLLN